MHLIVLAGHWRHEQSDHDLGGRDVQTFVQVHRTQRPRVGKTVAFRSATDDFTHQTHVVFRRVSRSGRGLTTSTVRLTTARSKFGTWMKTPTWKLCRYLRLSRLINQLDDTRMFSPSVSAASVIRTPSQAWTV